MNILLVETKSGRRFHREVEAYTSDSGCTLLRKQGIKLPESERLRFAKVQSEESILRGIDHLIDLSQRRSAVTLTTTLHDPRTPIASACAQHILKGKDWDAEKASFTEEKLVEFLGEVI